MALILFIIVTPLVAGLGVWHYSGYFAMMGEPYYTRLSRIQEKTK